MSYRQILIKSHKPKCVICLDVIQTIEEEVRLPCSCSSSLYHEQCILEYLESCGTIIAKCPTCRSEISPIQTTSSTTTTTIIQQSTPTIEESVKAMTREKRIHNDYLVYEFPSKTINVYTNEWMKEMQPKEGEDERSFLEKIEARFISALNKIK